jgi:hypothetical protein
LASLARRRPSHSKSAGVAALHPSMNKCIDGLRAQAVPLSIFARSKCPAVAVLRCQVPSAKCEALRLERWQDSHIRTELRTYVHVLSVCHLYPFTSYLKNTNENYQKILFSCNSSHNFTPTKRNELRYHFCLSQQNFIGH